MNILDLNSLFLAVIFLETIYFEIEIHYELFGHNNDWKNSRFTDSTIKFKVCLFELS